MTLLNILFPPLSSPYIICFLTPIFLVVCFIAPASYNSPLQIPSPPPTMIHLIKCYIPQRAEHL